MFVGLAGSAAASGIGVVMFEWHVSIYGDDRCVICVPSASTSHPYTSRSLHVAIVKYTDDLGMRININKIHKDK